MRKFSKFALLGCVLMLSACAPQWMRMVDTKDDVSFAAMYHAMKPAMLKKKMVDQGGNWYAPLFSLEASDAGQQLVDRLCPKFLGEEWNEPATRVFRDLITPLDRLSIGPYSATLRTPSQNIRLQLSAVVDWNDDGREDWLVTCRASRHSAPREAREYFLLITDTEAPVLRAYVLMERQHMYSRMAVIYDNSLSDFLAPVMVEVEQGELDVTQAPVRGVQSFEMSGVRTSTLSQ